MQELYSPKTYPQEIKAELKAMSPLAIEIANRWLLGWPKRVKALIEANQYLTSLKEQEEAEREAYSQGNQHLARHEIAELYGLDSAPPML